MTAGKIQGKCPLVVLFLQSRFQTENKNMEVIVFNIYNIFYYICAIMFNRNRLVIHFLRNN